MCITQARVGWPLLSEARPWRGGRGEGEGIHGGEEFSSRFRRQGARGTIASLPTRQTQTMQQSMSRVCELPTCCSLQRTQGGYSYRMNKQTKTKGAVPGASIKNREMELVVISSEDSRRA